jgi:hypothetical protein
MRRSLIEITKSVLVRCHHMRCHWGATHTRTDQGITPPLPSTSNLHFPSDQTPVSHPHTKKWERMSIPSFVSHTRAALRRWLQRHSPPLYGQRNLVQGLVPNARRAMYVELLSNFLLVVDCLELLTNIMFPSVSFQECCQYQNKPKFKCYSKKFNTGQKSVLLLKFF